MFIMDTTLKRDDLGIDPYFSERRMYVQYFKYVGLYGDHRNFGQKGAFYMVPSLHPCGH